MAKATSTKKNAPRGVKSPKPVASKHRRRSPKSSKLVKSKNKCGRLENSKPVTAEISGERSDSPQQLYCLCRQPDDNKFMIFCCGCEDWFHAKCVGVSEAPEAASIWEDTDWMCPVCQSNLLSKIQLSLTQNIQSETKLWNNLRTLFQCQEQKNAMYQEILISLQKKVEQQEAAFMDFKKMFSSRICEAAVSNSTTSRPPQALGRNCQESVVQHDIADESSPPTYMPPISSQALPEEAESDTTVSKKDDSTVFSRPSQVLDRNWQESIFQCVEIADNSSSTVSSQALPKEYECETVVTKKEDCIVFECKRDIENKVPMKRSRLSLAYKKQNCLRLNHKQ